MNPPVPRSPAASLPVLDSAYRAWWERFRRGLSRPSEASEPWSRWERARDLGAPIERVAPERGLTRGAELRERQERLEPVLEGSEPVLEAAFAATTELDFRLLLADREGVVVRAGGGGEFDEEARRQRLIEGASWSESWRGTNAIGTALAEARPVVIHGAAHYTQAFHGLVCYAAPIRDVDGTVLAVLDATSLVAAANPVVATVVSAAALAIEAGFRARAWASAGQAATGLVERTLDRVSQPALIVEAPGRVRRCNAAARVALGAGRPSLERLGVSWPALAEAARRTGAAVLPRFGESGPTRARLEPLMSPTGALLAVAVFVDDEPQASPSHPPAPRPPARAPARADDPFAEVFAEDPATLAAIGLGRRVAPSDLPIMLLAETGSGKERFANAMHRASRRRDGPFVAINCGSFTPELLMSELFGYGPGAFTGADRSGRDGLLHAAAGGTLFLDEVAEMPASMQVALLRVLEDGRYERVGERTPKRADVRVICATCQDLPSLVEEGRFRSDLWFRLKGLVLRLPPLRERTDRLALVRHLLGQARTTPPELDPALEAWILAQSWPGNIRELKSLLEVALVLAGDEPVLTLEHLPPDTPTPRAPERLEAVERQAMQRALDAHGGNVSAAARQLGVARSTIYRVLGRGSGAR